MSTYDYSDIIKASAISDMENIIEKIHIAALKFLEPLKPEETYKRIVDEAVKLVKGQDGSIILKMGDELETVYASTDIFANTKSRKRGFTYTAFSERKSFVIHPEEFGKLYPNMVKAGYQSAIFIPLFYKQKSFGVLIVRSNENQDFTDRELRILRLFGAMASMAIRKTQLLSEATKNVEIKDKFISLAAHELRTPLTSMTGYIQLLHRKLNNTSGVEKSWVESLQNESLRLTQLIEEILDINRMNAGTVKYIFEPCSILSIVETAISQLKDMYKHHDVVFKHNLTSAIDIVCDQKKMTQAIYNILENSAKFSIPNSKIIVELTSVKSYSIIRVSDTGKGISAEDLPYIFEGFYKGKGNEQQGMGLGLFFSKNVIEAHHGTISISSNVNTGTTAEIKLPKVKL